MTRKLSSSQTPLVLGDLQKMIVATSDEEAIQMIESYRQRMRDAGYDEMMDYIQQRMNEDPSIVY